MDKTLGHGCYLAGHRWSTGALQRGARRGSGWNTGENAKRTIAEDGGKNARWRKYILNWCCVDVVFDMLATRLRIWSLPSRSQLDWGAYEANSFGHLEEQQLPPELHVGNGRAGLLKIHTSVILTYPFCVNVAEMSTVLSIFFSGWGCGGAVLHQAIIITWLTGCWLVGCWLQVN